MNRRAFFTSAVASSLLPATASLADGWCYNTGPWTPQVCEAQIDMSHVDYQPQRMSQWCWAASTQIIFSYYGFSVSQEAIVKVIYGGLVNLPAFSAQTISKMLSSDWEDDYGRRFRCRIRGLYDFHAGIYGLNNATIINALSNDQPLFYANTSHAMVQTSILYQDTPYGPNVTNIGLLDPWPGRGLRGAEYGELTPANQGGRITYLALPQISALD